MSEDSLWVNSYLKSQNKLEEQKQKIIHNLNENILLKDFSSDIYNKINDIIKDKNNTKLSIDGSCELIISCYNADDYKNIILLLKTIEDIYFIDSFYNYYKSLTNDFCSCYFRSKNINLTVSYQYAQPTIERRIYCDEVPKQYRDPIEQKTIDDVVDFVKKELKRQLNA